ncbi:hypothetical protein MMC26_000400 [Xylographa opegraphella]|nr:hypothetical protein [Xylographa opegraphella]
MVETPDQPNLLDRFRTKAHVSKSRSSGAARQPTLPLSNLLGQGHGGTADGVTAGAASRKESSPTSNNVVENTSSDIHPAVLPPSSENGQGEASPTIKKPNFAIRFYHTAKEILLSSVINLLLVFVPVGIAMNFAGVSPTVVFALNAIAIIPLAGLLSHATEAVASSMGDTVGALMNVTFGNAVELIIFDQGDKQIEAVQIVNNSYAYSCHVYDYSIALVKNEIRIVQASLLGSILANLMLILGMCFLFGGLRFREQIYNSTVTQMSACLLSLSVMSLLLPTAFHASFVNTNAADVAVLQVSRGSSIILLLVYVLYLLFQLKSHAYMYESTPQHVIDEESHPGLLAEMLGSSSSSDTSGSSRDSDSDGSSGSNTTAKRIKRAFRGRRRRKSSASSKETPSVPSAIHTPSIGAHNEQLSISSPFGINESHRLGAIASGDEADTDGENDASHTRVQIATPSHRDFEVERASGTKSPESRLKIKGKRKHRKHHKHEEKQPALSEKMEGPQDNGELITPESQRVTFMDEIRVDPESSPRRPFNLRGISVRPTIPKMLTTTVFSTPNPSNLPAPLPAQIFVPPAPYGRGLRRTTSLPDRLNKAPATTPARSQQHSMQANASSVSIRSDDSHEVKEHISRTSAIVLLLISTGLVAVCAEFLVSSIGYLVDNSGVSEEFIGLIILPIVGNAAEHVTAVTVASKNKMDLAIGVAVGSSIQISLFVTPVIVLLGWILSKDMSLYFSLFETVSLFVSAFIVNFLVLDGRSNYLEGALLIAAYIIIAVAAFFYPNVSQQSIIGGGSIGS